MELRQPSIPDGLLTALTKAARYLAYTRPTTIYHMVWDYGTVLTGVFGDGANGAYEWFIWDNGARTLRTSDCAYGSDHVALCCGLVEAGMCRANGDHDLFLTWERRHV